MPEIPVEFIEYAFRKRVAALRSMLDGGLGQSALIGFTRSNPTATILFFTPPVTSYELRCSVEIHEGGPVWGSSTRSTTSSAGRG